MLLLKLSGIKNSVLFIFIVKCFADVKLTLIILPSLHIQYFNMHKVKDYNVFLLT